MRRKQFTKQQTRTIVQLFNVRRKRLTMKQRMMAIQFLRARDENRCLYCKSRFKSTDKKELAHKDENSSNNTLHNLALTHPRCNKLAFAFHAKAAAHAGVNVYVQPPQPDTPTRADGYAPFKRSIAEPLVRRYVFKRIKQYHGKTLYKSNLIRDAAAFSGASKQSVTNYIDVLSSPDFGPLDEEKYNEELIAFRDPNDYNLSLEDLETKYPYKGAYRAPQHKHLLEPKEQEHIAA